MKPNYYAVITANVRYDKNIPDGAKLLYAEITALCNQYGYCFASNAYFAELYGKSTRTIQNWLAALSKQKYIRVDSSYIGKDNTQRKVYLNHENNFTPPMKNFSPPHENNFTHNTTSNNSNIVDSKESTPNTSISTQKDTKTNQLDDKILTYLEAINKSLKKYGKSLTIPSAKTELRKYYAYKAVKRSINDFKATIEQWQSIIDIKGLEWKLDPKMLRHLKCDTIVAHWHKYLEQANERKGNEAPTDDIQLDEDTETKYQAFCNVYDVSETNLTQVSRTDYKWFFIDNLRRIEVKVARTAIHRELKNIIEKAKSDGAFGSLYKKLYNWYEIKAGLKRSY